MTLTQPRRSTPIGSISFSDSSSTTSARPSRPAAYSSATGSASTGPWPTARSSHTSWPARTDTATRYVAEWLRGQAAGGYISYDPETEAYSLSPEQQAALTDPDGAVYLPGAFQLALGSLRALPRVVDAFRTGDGIGWHEHDDDVFTGCERFFRPGYAANLVSAWLPALDGSRPSCETASRSPTSAAGWARRPC